MRYFKIERKDSKSTAVAASRWCLKDFLRPWRLVKSLTSTDKAILTAVLKQGFKLRDAKLDPAATPLAVLRELDWRYAACEEGTLTIEEVSAGPVKALSKLLDSQYATVQGRWEKFKEEMETEFAQTDGGVASTFVKDCINSVNSELSTCLGPIHHAKLTDYLASQ